MILGTFYFNLTTSGNLIGEFINQESRRAATESADRRGGSIDSFVGEYQSTWFDGQGRNMNLSISVKPPNENNENFLNIFRLVWSTGGTNHFFGEAFLVNNMLVGVYADEVLNNEINNLLNN